MTTKDYSLSIGIFLKRTEETFRIIIFGKTLLDKLKIFIWSILYTLARIFRYTLKLQSITERIVRNLTINIFGVNYVLPDSEGLLVLSPYFEKQVFDHLRPKNGDVFLDIGAHVGKYALQVAKAIRKDGLVIAIEPDPRNYRLLRKNIQINKLNNVIALNIAAWNDNKPLKLFIGKNSQHSSIKRNEGLGWITVEGKCLDDILTKYNIRHVDWIKIDVEGAELEVLKGLINTLKRMNPKIIIEVMDENKEKVFAYLRSFGYEIMHIGLRYSDCSYFYCEKMRKTRESD